MLSVDLSTACQDSLASPIITLVDFEVPKPWIGAPNYDVEVLRIPANRVTEDIRMVIIIITVVKGLKISGHPEL